MGVKILKGDEKITGGVTNINSDHVAIHKGYGYGFNIFESALAGQAVSEYSFKAPEKHYVHLKNIVIVTKGGNVKVEILKGVTVTADEGTAVSLNQLNDNSSNTADTTIKASPTYSGGTVWKTAIALADATNQTVGVGSFSLNPNQELVSKNNDEYYVIKITNLEADVIDAIDVTLDGFLYEEPKGFSD